ncbi:MAG: DNA alkylation repair protein [Planctomycetaceae bacterium]|nr:DNA alkylation repair protein [Planctomycetaceae bacterium]
MATLKSVMSELKKLGNERTRAAFIRHGCPEDRLFGVSVADMKAVAKKIKGEQQLACDLYETGNLDAMYLAGLVADGSQMTKKQLDSWIKLAGSLPMISEYTVPWLAVENTNARSLALKWMKARNENTAACGWCSYAGIITTTPDEDLDLDEIKELLNRIVETIDASKNRVRYTMNGFVIAVGCYVKPLLKDAKRVAKQLGVVSVDMEGTACKVPLATDYIKKVEDKDRVGKKRKSIRC